MTEEKSLQEIYAPNSICFGCGPSNKEGLHVRSFPQDNKLIAEWQPKKCYEAFAGILGGGIIGSLLDCHCNWTAAWFLKNVHHLDQVPCTVTAEYTIKLLRPTPTDEPVHLEAEVITHETEKATVQGNLIAKGKICATCSGIFVAVKPGHPAFHRW